MAIGIAGVREGGTGGALAATLALRASDAVAIGAHAASAQTGTACVSYAGALVEHATESRLIGVGAGVVTGDHQETDPAIDLRIGVRLVQFNIAFFVESIIPISDSPVPTIAFVVGYRR